MAPGEMCLPSHDFAFGSFTSFRVSASDFRLSPDCGLSLHRSEPHHPGDARWAVVTGTIDHASEPSSAIVGFVVAPAPLEFQ